MTSSAPKVTAADVLKRFYAAEEAYMASPPEARDFSGMAAVLSPEVRLHQSPDLPFGGVYEGYEGFQRWSRQMAELFDKFELRNVRVLEGGGTEVVVLFTLFLRVRRTQEERLIPIAQVDTIDLEKQVIAEFRPFYWDVAGLKAALERE